jgi:hypothetical protein
MRRKSSRTSILLALLLTFYQPVTFPLTEAQEEEQGRDIESIEVTRSRRRGRNLQPSRSGRYKVKQPATPNQTAKVGNRKSGRGRIPRSQESATITTAQLFPVGSPPKGKTYMTLGVTLWRIRLATEAESKDSKAPTEKMTWDGQEHEVIATRISNENSITEKDLIQMTVEYLPERNRADAMPSNQAVYLYVINREQFDSGLKNARLIFPTLLTYQGDNRLLPGKTVTLPDPKRPFRIKRGYDGGHSQSFETYTIILSPVPLDSELPQELSKKAMALTPNLVKGWEQQMGVTEIRADLQNGVGHARTQQELASSGDLSEVRGTEDSAEDLTQYDAPPQTVFRRVVKPGEGMLVIVRVPFKEASTKP